MQGDAAGFGEGLERQQAGGAVSDHDLQGQVRMAGQQTGDHLAGDPTQISQAQRHQSPDGAGCTAGQGLLPQDDEGWTDQSMGRAGQCGRGSVVARLTAEGRVDDDVGGMGPSQVVEDDQTQGSGAPAGLIVGSEAVAVENHHRLGRLGQPQPHVGREDGQQVADRRQVLEGAGGATGLQRPGQGQAAHHMAAADRGAGVTDEKDGQRGGHDSVPDGIITK